jgi:tetratricopeptide (TPR) repeat protein
MGKRRITRIARPGLALLAALILTGAGGEPWTERWNRSLRSAGEALAAGEDSLAEKHYLEAVEIARRNGEGTLRHARSLDELAWFYLSRERYEESVPLYRRTVPLWEELLGPDQPRLALSCHNLATAYLHLHRETEAEPFVFRALEIWEKHYGPEHLQVAAALQSWSVILRRAGRHDEAQRIEERIVRITGGGFVGERTD